MHSGWATRTAGTMKPLAPGEIPAIDAPIETGSLRVKTIAVDDRAVMRDAGVVVVDDPSVMMPIEVPMVPSPTEAGGEADAQIAGLFGSLPHGLNRLRDIRLLVYIGVTQFRCPCEVLFHVCEHRRKLRQSFYAGVPRLTIHGFRELVALETLVVIHPLRCLHD